LEQQIPILQQKLLLKNAPLREFVIGLPVSANASVVLQGALAKEWPVLMIAVDVDNA
jgi:hypothetical protein